MALRNAKWEWQLMDLNYIPFKLSQAHPENIDNIKVRNVFFTIIWELTGIIEVLLGS